MAKYNTLFPIKYIQDRLELDKLHIDGFDGMISIIERWKREIDSKAIYAKKEEQLQSDFLNDIFGKVLGYAYERGLDELNLEKEFKSKTDGTKPDGVLGYITNDNKDIRVVIELKDSFTNLDHKQNRKNDNRTPIEQAFSYVSKSGGNCKWVIVSNFIEIRLYPANDSSVYQSFNVVDLVKPDKLKEFWAILSKNRLFIPSGVSKVDELLKLKIEADETITKEFYNVYKNLRSQLFKHIKENNPDIDENVILTKSQKILDRIIFICFCEDLGLLPYKVFKEILHQTQSARFIMTDTQLWEQIKGLFTAIDKGYPQENINRFNGGLFKSDDVIDRLVIRDGILKEILSIEKYSFDSDLNVNILGHIFEQSITDLEELKSSINGESFDKKKGKRKKDGVFYTPEYITKYIISETIGSWLEDKKKELGYYELPKIDDDQWIRIKTGKVQKTNKTIKAHLDFWLKYREALNNIKVLDPACGSGSFLVQVFDYLKEQRNQVNEEIATFEGAQAGLFNADTHILSNNIYGVDLNDESVEITKLALWLKTANKREPLTALDNNIKCGNSLIDDVTIAGNKAFDWNKEFPEIMQNGGFDVIVGNPPYGVSFSKIEKKYLQDTFGNIPDFEIYIYFIEMYKKILKSETGYLSYIFPNTFLSNVFGKKYRIDLFNAISAKKIVDLSNDDTFSDASVRTCILLFKKTISETCTILCDVKRKQIHDETNMERNFFLRNLENILSLFKITLPELVCVNKIKENTHHLLSDYCVVSQGLIPYDKYRGHSVETIKNRIWHSSYQKDSTYKKELKGEDVEKYKITWNGKLWISYGSWLAAPREPRFFSEPRILIREITGNTLCCSYTEDEYYNTPSIINCISNNDQSVKWLLGILNSKLIGWYHNKTSPKAQKGLFPKILVNDVRNLPMPDSSFISSSQFVDFVDIMLSKNKELQDKSNRFIDLLKAEYETISISGTLSSWYSLEWKDFINALKKQKIVLTGSAKDDWFERFNRISSEIKDIQKTIDETDKQIDSLVYQLYGLTDEEIKIIESV